MNTTEFLKYVSRNFLPPVLPKALHRVRKTLAKKKTIHPFDNVPYNLDVKWVLDVGANVGEVSRAALLTYPQCRVIAFEPVKATFDELNSNTSQFGDRIVLFNLALSDSNSDGTIHITTAHGANSIEPHSPFHKHFNPHVREVGTETISLVRLDDIIDRLPTHTIDILKIDVEGHELSVLKGGREFIAKNVDIIVIEISLQRDQSWERQGIVELFSYLDSLGFRLINVFDIERSDEQGMMVVQMDCVFRRKSKLTLPHVS